MVVRQHTVAELQHSVQKAFSLHELIFYIFDEKPIFPSIHTSIHTHIAAAVFQRNYSKDSVITLSLSRRALNYQVDYQLRDLD